MDSVLKHIYNKADVLNDAKLLSQNTFKMGVSQTRQKDSKQLDVSGRGLSEESGGEQVCGFWPKINCGFRILFLSWILDFLLDLLLIGTEKQSPSRIRNLKLSVPHWDTRIQRSSIPSENPVSHFRILVTINFDIPEPPQTYTVHFSHCIRTGDSRVSSTRPPSQKSKAGYFQESRLIVFQAIGRRLETFNIILMFEIL